MIDNMLSSIHENVYFRARFYYLSLSTECTETSTGALTLLCCSFLSEAFSVDAFAMQDSSHASLDMIMTYSACVVLVKMGLIGIGWSYPDSIRRSSDYQADVVTTKLVRPLRVPPKYTVSSNWQ